MHITGKWKCICFNVIDMIVFIWVRQRKVLSLQSAFGLFVNCRSSMPSLMIIVQSIWTLACRYENRIVAFCMIEL